jgi:hypothetical protein
MSETPAEDGLTDDQRERQQAISRGANEVMDSLTGFELIAVKKVFGQSVADADFLTNTFMFAFVEIRRGDIPDADAYKQAMSLPIKTVHDRLIAYTGPGEVFEDEPETPQGKDESKSGRTPKS